MDTWHFEADYFTACNCDWGCPCNFNAQPTEGRCMGMGAWAVASGQFGTTSLDGTRFALYYKFPGSVENGQGTACSAAGKLREQVRGHGESAIHAGRLRRLNSAGMPDLITGMVGPQ